MSAWNASEDDVCELCGSRLTPQLTVKQHLTLEKEHSILDIMPDDSLFIVVLKKIGWVFQMIFMAILSFFIWLISIISG